MLLRLTRVGSATFIIALLMIGSSVSFAQQEPTANDLLERGVTLYEQGQYEQALETLNRIDEVQLEQQQRQTLRQTRTAIESQVAAAADLQTARQAERDGNFDEAKDIYRHIIQDRAAPRAVREQALAGLTRIERAERTGEGAGLPEVGEDVGIVRPVTPDEVDTGTTDLFAETAALEAQQAIELAREAEADRNYNLAASQYRRALELDPGNDAAQAGLQTVQAVLAGGTTQTGSILGDETTTLMLRQQRAEARYNEAIESANNALQRGEYAQARDYAALARSVLETNRNLFDAPAYRAMQQRAVDLAARIDMEQEGVEADEIARTTEEEAERAIEQRLEAERERAERVAELLENATELARQGDYELALEQVQQVLFLDSDHAAAKFMETMLRDQIIHRRFHDLRDEWNYQNQRQRLEAMEGTIPYTDLVVYPPDWPELTERRLAAMSQTTDSETNRATRERLQQPIPVDFQANRLENVIEYMRNVTGANFFVQWRALENAGIMRDTPITMQLQNVPAEYALRLILDEAGGELVRLGFTIDEGVVIIATSDFLAERTVLATYDIRDLIVQVPSFGQAPQFDLTEITSDNEGGSGGGIFSEVDADAEENLPRSERIQQIMDLIRNSVDPDQWRAAGGLTSTMEELSGTLIVNTTAENHLEIVQLLRQLREQRALQIAVESRFLFVTQNFLEEVGLDVDVSWNSDDTDDVVNNPALLNNTTGASGIAQPTNIGGTLAGSVPSLLLAGTDALGNVSSIGFVLDDLRVDLLVHASQKDIRNVTLNTPRVTFFNGQRAYVSIATQTAFVSDLEPVTATNAVAFDPEISVVSSGIVLDVEGTISADRRYVTMTLRPSLAQLVDLQTFGVFAATTDGDGDDDDDGGDTPTFTSGNIQQPIIQLTTVRTTVSVPDKGTLLIGGQRLVGEIEVENGVPVLSRVPIINRLFTNRATTRDEQTLLILIKPQIIVQSEEEERLFPGLTQQPTLYQQGR